MSTAAQLTVDLAAAAALGPDQLALDTPTRIDVKASGVLIPLLVVRRSGAEHLVVMNNGAVDQSRAKGEPIFQRSSWWSLIPHHQIYVADPATLGSEPLSLAWGNISDTVWSPTAISQAVLSIAGGLGVTDPERRAYFGSSAGGFMSLALLSVDPRSRAIINNAQFDWTRWMEGAVNSLRHARFQGRTPHQIRQSHRLTANVLQRLIDDQTPVRCDYYVNMASAHDAKRSLPEMERFIADHPELSQEVRIHRYSDPGRGHNPLTKEETLAILRHAFDPSREAGSTSSAAATNSRSAPPVKRIIRLKEHTPLSHVEHTPSDAYRETSDSSLGPGPFRARADSNGFLRTGNEISRDHPALILLGSSFVESMFVPEHLRFASILERRLAAAGAPHRVLNGGYSGTNTLQVTQSVISKVPQVIGQDGLLLLCIGQSDTEALLNPNTYWSSKPRIAPIQPTSPLQDNAFPEPAEALWGVVSLALSSAQSLGLRTGVIGAGFRDGDFSFDPVLRRAHRRNREAYNRVVAMRRLILQTGAEAAEAAGLPYFDGQRATADGSPELYYDVMHLNEAGQEVFAAALEKWVLAELVRRDV